MFAFYIILLIGLIYGHFATSGLKSQFVRLLDIFLIGPFMIYCGYILYSQTKNLIYLFLVATGASTITYNLRNYLYQLK